MWRSSSTWCRGSPGRLSDTTCGWHRWRYSIASVIPWVLVLALFGSWLVRETGSRTASFIAVAIVAQSPLVMETVWWYSASSFCWAIAGILLAILGASDISQEAQKRSLVLIGLGSMLGPAGSSLGHLAAPLAILRGFLGRGGSWRHGGLVRLRRFGWVSGVPRGLPPGRNRPVVAGRHRNLDPAELRMGLTYALSVPGRLLLPSALGLSASWCSRTLPPGWAGVLEGFSSWFWERFPFDRHPRRTVNRGDGCRDDLSRLRDGLHGSRLQGDPRSVVGITTDL